MYHEPGFPFQEYNNLEAETPPGDKDLHLVSSMRGDFNKG